MFIDASALCAILLAEPDAEQLASKILQAETRLTSAIAVSETVRALARNDSDSVGPAKALLDRFLSRTGIELVPIGVKESDLAIIAFDRFGKGRHPAKLNIGDCFAYACARARGEPLLFKGDDFPLTDIEAA